MRFIEAERELRWQLNFRQIILRVALGDEARAFDVNFARREGEVKLPVVRVLQHLRVAATQLIERPANLPPSRECPD